MKEYIKRDVELIHEIGCMRFLSRTWRQFLTKDFANVSEHTLRVIWTAMIIAKREKADVNKVIKMALIHDVPESRATDVHYLSRMFVKRDEEKAIHETLEGTSMEEFIDIWKEYEKRDSIEAKIVKDADNLDVDIELEEQHAKGNNLKKVWHEMRQRVAKKLYTETAKEIWKQLQESDPHSWHLTGSNRFTKGDWKE